MSSPSQRRSDRISIELPIQVTGCDAKGSQFIEEGKTRIISRHGGLIVLKRKVPPEAELILINPRLKEQAEVRVVGQVKTEAEGEVYGVAFLDADKSIWRIAFPPMDNAEDALARVLLQCSGCRRQEVVHFNEVDMEIFAARQELIRSCKSCSRATIWNQPGSAITPTTPTPEFGPVPTQEQKWIEKRLHRRTKVKLLACIRYSGREHIVDCEDISRGGFSFKGYRQYAANVEIDAAVPYTPGGGNIFRPARIAHCRARMGRLYKCGVAYNKSPELVRTGPTVPVSGNPTSMIGLCQEGKGSPDALGRSAGTKLFLIARRVCRPLGPRFLYVVNQTSMIGLCQEGKGSPDALGRSAGTKLFLIARRVCRPLGPRFLYVVNQTSICCLSPGGLPRRLSLCPCQSRNFSTGASGACSVAQSVFGKTWQATRREMPYSQPRAYAAVQLLASTA